MYAPGSACLQLCGCCRAGAALWPLMGYVGRGPKQTWWSARKLAPWCCKLSCSVSCSIWAGQQNSGCCILSAAVRQCGTHMEKEGVDLDLSFLPPNAGPCAAGRLLTLGMLGSCPSEMLNPHRGFSSGFRAQFHFTSNGGLLCPLILCWGMAGILRIVILRIL